MAFFAILCLLSTLTLIGDRLSVRGNQVEIHVYPGPSAIQNAINNASSGDTIIVHAGVYTENIRVNKSVSLIGENAYSTIIDGNRTGNVVTIDVSGVKLENFTIKNSGITAASDSGIFIVINTDNNSILNNVIINNTHGIFVNSAYNNLISHNLIANNTHGVTLSGSYGNLLSSNVINSNREEGIFLSISNNNMILNNTVAFNRPAGMRLLSSLRNNVSSNTVMYNQNGVFFGLGSGNNTFYHNNFIMNDLDVGPPDTGPLNFWSFKAEGNHWSNYTGVDLNRDGIGDSPKIIDSVNVDDYPLMGVFFEWQIALDHRLYNVAIISNSTISDFGFRIGTETGNAILSFKATGENATYGFCRVKIAADFMDYPYIVLVDGEEVIPTVINATSTYVISYLVYAHKNGTITIISSKTLHLYLILQENLHELNATYYQLLSNYTILQTSFYDLNQSYGTILENYAKLQDNFSNLNKTYYTLLNDYNKLRLDFDALELSNQALIYLNQSYYYLNISYNALLNSFNLLNSSYQAYLNAYSVQAQNNRNMAYIFTAIAATIIVTTVYFSKRAHTNSTTKQR
ncbi:right-handed parallel beta-helix repeat-containing protein [Candidatus Bathyarchaeota archaeon]|nr:right-handed parallel beta-helix repeat-containing protein [Candidatus Bathyarchaeota archaeon]